MPVRGAAEGEPSEASKLGNRRQFLRGLGVAAAGLGARRPGAAEAEPPPETTRIRLLHTAITCIAPQYVALELLKAEGFTDVQYVAHPRWNEALAAGDTNFSLLFIPSQIAQIDAGAPVVALAGSHIGCVELFGSHRVRSTRELKGKRIAVSELGGDQQIFTSMFVAHVGLDPRKDIEWVVHPLEESAHLLAERKIDAVMTAIPFALEMRANKIGHVLVNTTTDKPWSQYVCCVLMSHREFVRKHPVATKRALRAILKATDLCASEPVAVARRIASQHPAMRYEQVLQTLREIPFGRWREYDPEDAIRFYALRLHEAGMIKSSPQRIIAQGTDWRFLRELKRELKA